ncbi:ciliary microtubule inner protein 4 isoform X2 [Osmerus eperlanus]|uniref:ciliary microtubule inner protein 4 isoform X2 n=1 Tax=Osmerus eperlanus TaxID=29151 RepID=UPI002E114871
MSGSTKINHLLHLTNTEVRFEVEGRGVGAEYKLPAMTSLDQSETATDDRSHVVRGTACSLLVLPHYSDTGSTFSSRHSSYHSLGHCLRSNIFPGAPLEWKSLVQESYILHPLAPPPPNPQRWYGRRTDDLVRWTERNIVNQKLNKALQQMESKGTK